MSTRSGTQCGWSCRADGPGARGEEGPRPAGLRAGQEDLEESVSRRGEGPAAALEEAPIGRVYTSDRSPLGGGVLSASLGICYPFFSLVSPSGSGHS